MLGFSGSIEYIYEIYDNKLKLGQSAWFRGFLLKYLAAQVHAQGRKIVIQNQNWNFSKKKIPVFYLEGERDRGETTDVRN